MLLVVLWALLPSFIVVIVGVGEKFIILDCSEVNKSGCEGGLDLDFFVDFSDQFSHMGRPNRARYCQTKRHVIRMERWSIVYDSPLLLIFVPFMSAL